MIGVFGKVSKIKNLGLKPDVIYTSLDKINTFDEKLVPLLWVPKAMNIDEGVEDIYGRKYLFAFNNSGCIAKPGIINYSLEALERAHSLGYKKLMLDAIRLPSPIDGLYFLTTCFCSYSLELYSKLRHLRDSFKNILRRPTRQGLLELLDELAYARTEHVENLLSILYDRAKELDVKLIAAVFPYPLSRYVGQEPKVLEKYLSRVHVMLYHKCSGAACLNAEVKHLVKTLRDLGFNYDVIQEIIEDLVKLKLSLEEINSLDQGLNIKHIEGLAKLNKIIYGNKFIPIIWLDENTHCRLESYLGEYQYIDLFVS
ncbi:MAG: hypothetical protein DRN04_17520 [Thermoprotei archaeon]|nr:MAG: hypothetical protein DRN04_17520 [Thermoprotei archaeon]